MLVNPGIDAQILDVELIDAENASLVGFLLHPIGDGGEAPIGADHYPPRSYETLPLESDVPFSVRNDLNEFVPSLQLLLGVDFRADGRYSGVRVRYVAGGEPLVLEVSAAAEVVIS